MSSPASQSKSLKDPFAGVPIQSNWELIKWMCSLGLRYRLWCFQLICLNVVIIGIMLSIMTITGLIFDVIHKAVDPDNAPSPKTLWGLAIPPHWDPFNAVIVLVVITLLLSALRMGIRYILTLAQARLVQTVLTNLRQQVYDKLQRLSFRFFDANETGSLINRATTDASQMATFTEQALIQVLVLLITIAAYLAYMVNLNLKLTLLGMATTPLLLAASIYFSKVVRPGYEQARKLFDDLIRVVSENVQGQHVVKGFARQQAEIEKFKNANQLFRTRQRWLFVRTALYSAITDFFTQANIIIVLAFGGYIIIDYREHYAGQLDAPPAPLTVGTLIVFAGLLQSFSQQVTTIANLANTLQTCLTAAGRVRQVLDTPMEVQSKPGALQIPSTRGHIKFENVGFSYDPEDQPVLQDVSFEVKPGQCVAILGATGAGKSTLLSLIPRFYDPTKGRVFLDGHDLRDIQLDDLRRHVGVVFQESFLFSNTIAANISFGCPTATRADIEAAARIASAHKFISEMEKGYDTVIGEYGSTLSGGQRQRLAIARAILLHPSVLILDDATAAIDPETEHEILEAMDNAMKGRTTFVVAHRLSTLRRADFIIVLDHGRIIQKGTHEQLIHQEGRYSEVASLQLVDEVSDSIIRARMWYDGLIKSPIEPEAAK